MQRWMFFAKYLKQFGHNPIILTVDPKYASYNLIDNSLIDQVKDIEAHKTASFEILKLYSIFTGGIEKTIKTLELINILWIKKNLGL